MISVKCLTEKVCLMLGLLEQKLIQSCEVILQQEFLCEKLDAIIGTDGQPCPACPEPIIHRFSFRAFDTADLFDAEFVHQTTVNGISVNTPRDPSWTTKGQHYQGTVDAVNSVAGATMTLTADEDITVNNQAPLYEIEYDASQPVTIVNEHTGVVRTFSSDENGNCVSTFQDAQGNDITSNQAVEL